MTAKRKRAEPDHGAAVDHLLAADPVMKSIVTRVGPIMRVVRDAAVVDPEMAEQWATNQTQTAAAFGVLAEQLDAMHALRVPVEEATDILCAISGLSMYLVLTDRGWTAAQWEHFAVDTVAHALLQPH